jgi:hypothetical protein
MAIKINGTTIVDDSQNGTLTGNLSLSSTSGTVSVGNATVNTTANATTLAINGTGAQARLGNSTVNTVANATTLSINGTGAQILLGNTTVNTAANATTIAINGTDAQVSLGNATINTVINATSIKVTSIFANSSNGTSGQVLTSNGTGLYWSTPSGGGATLTSNNTVTQTFYFPMSNTTSGSWTNGVVSGSLLNLVPSSGVLTVNGSLNIGNSTVNVAVNATSLFTGNSTINAVVNSSTIAINGSTTSGLISVGNGTVNATVNSTALYLNNSLSPLITVGNATNNTAVSDISVVVSNSTITSTLGVGRVTVGNTTVNTAANATSIAAYNISSRGGNTTLAPISITSGSLLSSIAAGSVEYDGVRFYGITDTTSGRGYIQSTNIFRLTVNGSAIGPALSNYFGATSAINLAAGGIYELQAFCYFTKTTANTITVTLTSSQTPVLVNGTVDYGAAAGGTATGAANRISLVASTAAAAAFGASASLTAAGHAFMIRAIIQQNASLNGTLTINFTQGTGAAGGGTVTPLAGSYYRVTRLPATNSGVFS